MSALTCMATWRKKVPASPVRCGDMATGWGIFRTGAASAAINDLGRKATARKRGRLSSTIKCGRAF